MCKTLINKMMWKVILVIVFLNALTICANAQMAIDPNFHLYILMGQSNMAGRGEITEAYRSENNSRVFMLNKDNQWIIAKHPLHFDKPSIAGVGPGLAFGIIMAEADTTVKIGLIPCAVGGTEIELWQPFAYDKITKTHPYDDAIIRIKEATKSGVLKGVLWHQGEGARTPEKASDYHLKLAELIERIRREVNNPKLPFIAGEIGRYLSDAENFNNKLIKLPELVPYTAVANSEGLVHKGDNLHFNSPSAEKLGRRFAEKMKQLQKQ